jgi:hypothetical protein
MPPPDPLADELARLHHTLGLKRLSPAWAKLELLGGLAVAAAGLVGIARGPDPLTVAAGAAAFALGFYLALAGHRSHLYQSNNRLAAYLAALTRSRHEAQPGDRS